jgi:hypothetical protein
MTTTSRPTSSNGQAASGSNGHGRMTSPTLTPPRRRFRVPELAVGVLVIVGFALGAVMWHLTTTSKAPALAISAEVHRGDVVESTDLRTIYVASEDALFRITDPSRVVGKVALVDLGPGTILSPSLVADGQSLAPGNGVVGLALDPGQYPAFGLAPGDRVNVVRSGDAAATTGTTTNSDQVIARGATIFAVEDLASDRKLVSIQAAESDADAVAAAAGSSGLSLVLVSP